MLSIKENVPLAPLTTFGIGGDARYFVDVRTEDDVRAAMKWAAEKGTRCMVWAGGSNVLVPDGGINALIVRFVGNLWSVSGNEINS